MFKRFLVLVIFLVSYTQAIAQSVDTAWVRRYNGPGNGTDGASAIAVDSSGSVYVTGYSTGSGTSSDYATIKYDPAGNQLWVQRYNGPGNSDDGASAIAVDGFGNVYVTGRSIGSGTSSDYATIKYDPAGNQLWVQRYDGPGNSVDNARAIAVDGSGNVYVTGESQSRGTGFDYATIKYDAAGNQLSVRRYNGPGNGDDYATGITVDGSSNVYVTGRSVGNGTAEDYATIKYDPAGNQLWVQRYNGPGNGYDEATSMSLDDSGNVYVTGRSTGSGTSYDYATIKYDPGGSQLWVKRVTGPYDDDESLAIAVDGSGNAYVTGYVTFGRYQYNKLYVYVTLKYDQAGNQLWLREYSGPASFQDQAKDIVVDDSGNVCVTGESWARGTSYDYATIEYNPAGTQLWVQRYNGTGNGSDYATAMAVDGCGNVYVTGRSQGSGTSYDYATLKYVQFLRGDTNGNDTLSLADIVYLINYLFKFGPAPEPIQSGDANCDGKVSLSDIVYLINYLFKGGPSPCI